MKMMTVRKKKNVAALERDRIRKRKMRENMTEAQRESYNHAAKMRMRRYREKKNEPKSILSKKTKRSFE